MSEKLVTLFFNKIKSYVQECHFFRFFRSFVFIWEDEIESLRVETERETKSTNKMPRKHRIRSHFSAFAIIFEITKTNRI